MGILRRPRHMGFLAPPPRKMIPDDRLAEMIAESFEVSSAMDGDATMDEFRSHMRRLWGDELYEAFVEIVRSS